MNKSASAREILARNLTERVLTHYLTCDDPGREILNHIAEREAEYKTRSP